ncbi:MAG: type II/IV secretion system protein, partial [Pirellulaceae bacterium]
MDTGEILLKHGLINQSQLELIRDNASQAGQVLRNAIDKGYVKEVEALRALAEEVGVDFIDLRSVDVDLTLLDSVPQKIIFRQTLFPVRRENGAIVVATNDPFDLYPLDEVSA